MHFFFGIFPKFSDLVNSNDYIEKKKTHQNVSGYNQCLFKKRFEVNKKTDIL